MMFDVNVVVVGMVSMVGAVVAFVVVVDRTLPDACQIIDILMSASMVRRVRAYVKAATYSAVKAGFNADFLHFFAKKRLKVYC